VSSGSRIEHGGYLAIRATGIICCGHQNGMKLYVHPGPAIKRAGPGGSVYRIWHNGYGVTAERVHGPVLSFVRKEEE